MLLAFKWKVQWIRKAIEVKIGKIGKGSLDMITVVIIIYMIKLEDAHIAHTYRVATLVLRGEW